MSCYVGAPENRRAEPVIHLTSHLIADARCHVFSNRVDSTLIQIQPAALIIHPTYQSINRGAARDKLSRTRSADITPELTGRARTAEMRQVSRIKATLFALRLNELLC